MLFIVRGVSGSGKSYNLKSLQSLVVSSDSLRVLMNGNAFEQVYNKSVFDTLRTIVEQRMSVGVNTIIDATNLKLKDVKGYIEIANKYRQDYLIISIDPDREVCLNNLQTRVSNGGLYIPPEVVDKQIITYWANLEHFEKFFGDTFTRIPDATYLESEIVSKAKLKHYRKLNKQQDLWVIGDIHGCHKELNQILDDIYKVSTNPKIVSVGDIIDRTPHSFKCLDILEDANAEVVLGNHELKFLREYDKVTECRSLNRRETHEVFGNFPKHKQEHYLEMITKMPHWLKFTTAGGSCVVSHGGVCVDVAELSLSQSVACFGRSTDQGSSWGKQVHGHKSWEYEDITTQNGEIINVDGGCVYGGELVAYNPFISESIAVKAFGEYIKNKE